MFDNRYRIDGLEPKASWTPEEFFVLRNKIFTEREQRIRVRREEEKAFFSSKPWDTW